MMVKVPNLIKFSREYQQLPFATLSEEYQSVYQHDSTNLLEDLSSPAPRSTQSSELSAISLPWYKQLKPLATMSREFASSGKVPKFLKPLVARLAVNTPNLGMAHVVSAILQHTNPIIKASGVIFGMHLLTHGAAKPGIAVKNFASIMPILAIQKKLHLPSPVVRSLLGASLTFISELKDGKITDLGEDLKKIFASKDSLKSLAFNLGQMEFMLNSVIPITRIITQKVKNPALRDILEIANMSLLFSAIPLATDKIKSALGIKSATAMDRETALAQGVMECPICGEFHADTLSAHPEIMEANNISSANKLSDDGTHANSQSHKLAAKLASAKAIGTASSDVTTL